MFVNKFKTIAIVSIAVLCVSMIAGAFMPFYVQAFGFENQDSAAQGMMMSDADEKINIVLNDRGTERKFTTTPTTCESFLKKAGVVLAAEDVLNVGMETQLSDDMVIEIDRIEYDMETRVESNQYTVKEVPVDTIPKGTREVASAGIPGQVQRTYLVKYVNGERVDEALYAEYKFSDPVEEIVNVGVGGTVTAQDGTVYEYNYRKEMEATAYTYVPGLTTMTTATGETLRKGIVAVDPRVIPMHTKMFITGPIEYGLGVAEDTGGVIKGNIVDLAYMSYDECIQFGRRQMQVYILD